MKIQRNKKLKKRLEFFKQNFSFKAPYKLLIDGTFCFAALQHKVNIKDQLPQIFEDNLKILTTPCIVTEMQKMGPAVYGAFLIVKQFIHHQCGHTGPETNAAKCLISLVKNRNTEKFCVATQDADLRSRLRRKAGVPILYLHQSAPTLEKPAEVSASLAERKVASRTGVSREQMKAVTQMKRQAFGEPEEKLRRKTKKKKGPNPLSCRRKKLETMDRLNSSATGANTTEEASTRKRKKRVRIPTHVKEELARLKSISSNVVNVASGDAS